MLELRPICENCGKKLLPDSPEAMICSFECTYCSDCVHNILHNVCPNCGGGFESRPVRPKEKLLKNPPRVDETFKPVSIDTFQSLLQQQRNIPAHLR